MVEMVVLSPPVAATTAPVAITPAATIEVVPMAAPVAAAPAAPPAAA
ncbi:MAG: hypothetical protein HYV18_09310, partial [Gammaproteobacteria bacterium]|nr:hypothetical protein [Gammaproteobacteria bacterium]